MHLVTISIGGLVVKLAVASVFSEDEAIESASPGFDSVSHSDIIFLTQIEMLTVNNSGRRKTTSTILLLPHLFLRHNNRMTIRTLRILLFKVMNCTQCRSYKRSESDFKIETDRALSAGRIDYRRPLEFFPPYVWWSSAGLKTTDRVPLFAADACM